MHLLQILGLKCLGANLWHACAEFQTRLFIYWTRKLTLKDFSFVVRDQRFLVGRWPGLSVVLSLQFVNSWVFIKLCQLELAHIHVGIRLKSRGSEVALTALLDYLRASHTTTQNRLTQMSFVL